MNDVFDKSDVPEPVETASEVEAQPEDNEPTVRAGRTAQGIPASMMPQGWEHLGAPFVSILS